MEKDQFEALKDEYYQLRGWDVSSGLPTRSTMQALKLEDIADDLEKSGLLK